MAGQIQAFREKKAFTIIQEGFSANLILPNKGIVKSFIDGSAGKIYRASTQPQFNENKYRLYENTHLELIRAKRIMEILNLNSANIVSSPYHVKRIKLIASHVFDGERYEISCIAAEYHAQGRNFWFLSAEEFYWVVTEYLKILWFKIYQTFI
jgi:hypothetical protein